MINPFEDEQSEYLVLINDKREHSLWPASIQVPAGWNTALGPTQRSACLDWITEHWTEMRARHAPNVTD